MPPRFMQRMQMQSETLKGVFGEQPANPPPYPQSRGKTAVSAKASKTSLVSTNSVKSPPPSYQRSQQLTHLEQPAIPRGSLILVTAANSWQGVHIVDQLLEYGYNVRGAVRDAEKASWTNKFFESKYGAKRYTAEIVPDMVVPGAYNIAAKGCVGIVHVASVMTFSPDPNDVIPQSIIGAINALEAAAREPRVRRFVYCSSVTAATNPGSGARTEVGSESWNMGCFKTAWDKPPYELSRSWAVFSSSKLQAEQAVWKWYREKRPNFVLNSVLPDMLWGQVIAPQQPGTGLSMHILKSIFNSESRQVAWVPPQHFSDVQDSALVHVAALILSGVMNERLFVTTLPYNINSMTQLLRGLFPTRHFTGWVQDHGVDQTYYRESGRALELLRRMGKSGWTDIETSVTRACESFL